MQTTPKRIHLLSQFKTFISASVNTQTQKASWNFKTSLSNRERWENFPARLTWRCRRELIGELLSRDFRRLKAAWNFISVLLREVTASAASFFQAVEVDVYTACSSGSLFADKNKRMLRKRGWKSKRVQRGDV